MTDKRTQEQADRSNMEKRPEDWTTGDEPMTGAQRSYLKTLSEEAKVRFDDQLTKAEASRRIDELQQRTGRGQEGAGSRQEGAGSRREGAGSRQEGKGARRASGDARPKSAEEQTRESDQVEVDAQGGELRGVKDR